MASTTLSSSTSSSMATAAAFTSTGTVPRRTVYLGDSKTGDLLKHVELVKSNTDRLKGYVNYIRSSVNYAG